MTAWSRCCAARWCSPQTWGLQTRRSKQRLRRWSAAICLLVSNRSSQRRRSIAAFGVSRPGELRFSPFYKNYDRRSAVYFRRFTDAQWVKEEAAFAAEQARQKDLAARSVDVMHLGEMQPERDHDLRSDISYPVVYRGRNGRDARTGGFFSFRMKVRPGPLILQASYWADERKRLFHISIDGVRIASQTLKPDKPVFFEVDYPIPEALTRGKQAVEVRFEPEPGNTAGPGVRLPYFHARGHQRVRRRLRQACFAEGQLTPYGSAA